MWPPFFSGPSLHMAYYRTRHDINIYIDKFSFYPQVWGSLRSPQLLTLTNCTDNLFGDPGSTFPSWQESFWDALLHDVEKLLLPIILPCLIYVHSHHWIPIGNIKQFTSPRKVCQVWLQSGLEVLGLQSLTVFHLIVTEIPL